MTTIEGLATKGEEKAVQIEKLKGEVEGVLDQRDQAMQAMRDYQFQCDSLRGEISNQELQVGKLKEKV